MRIFVIHFLFLLCLSQLIEAQTQPVDIGYANLDITWDKAPLTAYKFRNGDKIEIVSSHKQWFKNCDSRKPSVWIYTDEAEDKVVYLYNYFAITDGRKLAPQGYEIPTRGLLSTLNGTPQSDFPFSTEPGKYLAIIRETKKTEIVNQSFYFWTSTAHESSLEGEEIAYIGSADRNSRMISSSTGEFCEGYPVICFKSKPKAQYDYELLLPGKYNDLYLELNNSINQLDWSVLNGKFSSDSLKLSLEGYLSFSNSGENTSEGFDVAYDSETKLNGLDLVPLNDKMNHWPYYPESFGVPVPVGQLIRFNLKVKNDKIFKPYSSPSCIDYLWFNGGKFVWLKNQEDSKVVMDAMNLGRTKEVTKYSVFNVDATNYDKPLFVQYTLDEVAFRGPGYCLMAPFGQATRLITSHYAKSYKKPLLSSFLSLSVPILLIASTKSLVDFQDEIKNSPSSSVPGNTPKAAALKRDTAILTAITGSLIAVDLSFGIHFSHKNMLVKRRFMKLKRAEYSNGITFIK